MKHVIRYTDQNITEINPAEIPEIVPIIPLRNAVVFPGIILPIFVGRSESVQLIEQDGKPGSLIGLFTQKNPEAETVTGDDLFSVGSLAEIHRVIPMGEGGYQVFLQGVQKIELAEILTDEPYLKARIKPVFEEGQISSDQFLEFQAHVIRYIENNPGIPDEVIAFVRRITSAASLANQVIFFSGRSIEEKIQFLSLSSLEEKVRLVQTYLIDETQRLVMEKEVREKVEKDAAKMQRDFYLRKQLETIRKELGDSEESEADELERQLQEMKLPEYVRKVVDKELKRYRRLTEGPQSGGMEASQIRNWLDLIIELPWPQDQEGDEVKTSRIASLNLAEARRILDEDHEGLEEVKERILEHLAVEKKAGPSKAPILCLVGPPGVGKTSLAQSVARALNRKFVRAALGGVRDEAEIRGHRRTYVGALPGKIISSFRKCGTVEPVFLLDEIDKLGSSYQGDPAAALLEVLDPEQNHNFEDHYLGVPYDLSRALFFCTANTLDTIPVPLLDRMEIVTLSGYTLEEKIAIAEKHLIPRIRKDLQLTEEQFSPDRDVIIRVIEDYTREAGVRNLKRRLESIGRKIVLKLEEKNETSAITVDSLIELLGRPKYHRDRREHNGIPGVATGLAWTPVGGDILFIESTAFQGKGALKLSGRLGEVMKESAQAAFSFLKAHARELNLNEKIFEEKDVHIHIPGGAVPKDGPSAGVTLLTAMTSLFSGVPVAEDIAMTGEISLRGRILPVGGIKEKVLAARAAGINTVLLPESNRADFEEIPESIRKNIHAEFYSDMMQLLRRTVPAAFKRRDKVDPREGW
jgi:ATP-dependent Lon protease